jgi:SPP1 gp7 family putative phage head morphogenesis protein
MALNAARVTSVGQTDPTRTGLLRRRFEAEARSRFVVLKGQITRALSAPRIHVADHEFIEQFTSWLDQTIQATVLGSPWWERFVEDAYRRGAGRSFDAVDPPKDYTSLDRPERRRFVGQVVRTVRNVLAINFDPDQPRDDHGRWSDGGGVDIYDPNTGDLLWTGPEDEARKMLAEQEQVEPGHGLKIRPASSEAADKKREQESKAREAHEDYVEPPETLYHATFAGEKIRQEGFRSSSELGIQVLGGSSSHLVSFTTKENAETYRDALDLARRAARDELSAAELVHEGSKFGVSRHEMQKIVAKYGDVNPRTSFDILKDVSFAGKGKFPVFMGGGWSETVRDAVTPELVSTRSSSASEIYYNPSEKEWRVGGRLTANASVSMERVRFLAQRLRRELKGVTDATAQSIARSLADGLAKGKSPIEIAKAIRRNVDGIGIARSRLIAQTEVTRAVAEGAIDAMEDLGVSEVAVAVEWSTTGTPCPLCKALEGVVFSIKEIRGLIPRHPNCKCFPRPATKKDVRGQSESSVRRAVKKSVDLEGGESRWTPPKIAKKRPVPLGNVFCPTGPGGGVDPNSKSRKGS